MGNILLGGLIALAGTCIVQIVVVPWVQIRNRRRERWESALIELMTLLEEELPHALRRLRRESRDLRKFRAYRDLTTDLEASLAGPEADTARNVESLADRLEEAQIRIRRLVEQARSYHHGAGYWTVLTERTYVLVAKLWSVAPEYTSSPTAPDTDIAKRWKEAESARAETLEVLKRIMQPIRPPRSGPLQHLRRPPR